MTGTKDVLEFPLAELGVVEAINLMMQAAAKVGAILEEGNEEESQNALDRLQLLCEKLQNRIEDELEQGIENAQEVDEDDVVPTYTSIEDHKVTLVHEFVEFANDDVITRVVVDDVVFGLFCNERVFTDPETLESTTCVKQWNHDSMEHEDSKGNIR